VNIVIKGRKIDVADVAIVADRSHSILIKMPAKGSQITHAYVK